MEMYQKTPNAPTANKNQQATIPSSVSSHVWLLSSLYLDYSGIFKIAQAFLQVYSKNSEKGGV